MSDKLPWRTLRQARRTARLSAVELSRRAGFSTSYVGLLERGERRPSADTIERLAKALDCDPADIEFGTVPDDDYTVQIKTLTAQHADLGDRIERLARTVPAAQDAVA